MMENTLGNSSTSFFSTPRWTRSSALWVSEWDNRSLTTSSWATRSLFCSLALYTRSGGWLPWKYLVFLLKTEARRALNTYAFSSLHPKEDGGFPWACSFVNVLIEMIVIIFPSVARLSSRLSFSKAFFYMIQWHPCTLPKFPGPSSKGDKLSLFSCVPVKARYSARLVFFPPSLSVVMYGRKCW